MLRVNNISVIYPGGATALHSTSIDFSRSEFTVILGSSGAGKSTLLRCLNYLIQPTNGEIIVEGMGRLENNSQLRKYRRRTAMIFQQHQLIARRSVLQNVLVGRIGYYSTVRSLFPLPKQEVHRALECLDRVGLLHKANERVDSLSGGEQQRVGIARALTQQPQLILADEPVASIDPVTATRVLSLLRTICKEDNIPAVVSLHQVDFARSYADRIIGLTNGRIVFDGRSEELTNDVLNQIYHNSESGNKEDRHSCSDTKDPTFAGLAIASFE